ncbi:MAG: M64 family metallopeptidase [Planctomycetota bacterium]
MQIKLRVIFLVIIFSVLPFVSLLGQDEKKAGELFKQAQLLLQQDQFEEARVIFNQIIKKYPGTTYATQSQEYVTDNALLKVTPLVNNGRPQNRINIVIMGDAYKYLNKQQKNYSQAAGQMPREFYKEPTFEEYASYFNIYRVNIASKDANVDSDLKECDTALGGYLKGRTPGVDMSKVQEYCAKLAFRVDVTWVVLQGDGSVSIGGPGLLVTFAGFNALVHETGHALVRLGDEYIGAGGPDPGDVNISDTSDPTKVPWAHWLTDPKLAKLLKIGVFERGDGTKVWRPTPGTCEMATPMVGYCPVCREHAVRSIYRFINPIDERAPNKEIVKLKVTKVVSKDKEKISYKFPKSEKSPCWLIPLQPATHKLQVKWYLKESSLSEADDLIKSNSPITDSRGYAGFKLEGRELAASRYLGRDKRWVEYPDFSTTSLAPGYYILTAQVKDEPFSMVQTTKVPWVIKNEPNFLEEHIAWGLEVTEAR